MPMAGRFPSLCVCLLAAIAVSGGEIVFHVRSAAGVGGDGTREKPFNTIWAAREKIKTAFRDGLVPDGTDAVISFAPGVHRLGAGISLSAADSGRSGRSRVIWRAQESGKTVFTRVALLKWYTTDMWAPFFESQRSVVAAILPSKAPAAG